VKNGRTLKAFLVSGISPSLVQYKLPTP
jgi:hypothetical protein